jgi:hypothetical protein
MCESSYTQDSPQMSVYTMQLPRARGMGSRCAPTAPPASSATPKRRAPRPKPRPIGRPELVAARWKGGRREHS